jgi:hypothetical protein
MLASVSDSGSNNFTMAREMQRQLKEEGYKSDHSLQWDPKSMSITGVSATRWDSSSRQVSMHSEWNHEEFDTTL